MSATVQSLPKVPSNPWPRIGWGLLMIGALYAGGHALWVVVGQTLYGSDVMRERVFAVAFVGYAHTLGGGIASLIGPFQFIGSLRRRYPRGHVWLGRVYLVSVGSGALAGLYLSPNSYAASIGDLGFVLLALAWLFTGGMAYRAIRGRRIDVHRRWMIRNYALTFSAFTLRAQLPLLVIFGGFSPYTALTITAFSCWLPSLLVVELWMNRHRLAPRRVMGAHSEMPHAPVQS